MDLAQTVAAFEAHTGAALVFEAEALPPGAWYDLEVPLEGDRRLWAAQIALGEARRLPPGYLADVGISTVGLFAAVGSKTNDGFHTWDDDLGGYAYYGMSRPGGLVAAAYTEGQLPLTFHHEVFHAVDRTAGDAVTDARFLAAVSGEQVWAAPVIAERDLAALRARGIEEIVLADAVSDYAAKAVAEDEAETARHLMSHLPDALVQIVDHPELPGSQRFLTVLAEYAAVPGGPGVGWFVDQALGRAPAPEVARWRSVFKPDGFVVYGAEDAEGVNWTLRAQVAAFGAEAGALPERLDSRALVGVELEQLALLSTYFEAIDDAWTVTSGTRDVFEAARARMVDALPQGPVANAVARASLEDLAATLPGLAPDDVPGALAVRGVEVNRYVRGVDDRVVDAEIAAAIRRVQPATVRVTRPGGSGSGVNLAADGRVLTAGHVGDGLGETATVEFPDGSSYLGTVVAYDALHDLALLDVEAHDLPWARVAGAAPVEGDAVVIVGQPGTRTPGGEPTGYQPFHVSVGQIRGFLDDRYGDQGLGRTKHDAWTYWGHSGSPLFDARGDIVALHNSWDSQTAMRHAVTWEAITAFLAEAP